MYYPNHDCSIFTVLQAKLGMLTPQKGPTATLFAMVISRQHKSPAPKKEFKEQLRVGIIFHVIYSHLLRVIAWPTAC